MSTETFRDMLNSLAPNAGLQWHTTSETTAVAKKVDGPEIRVNKMVNLWLVDFVLAGRVHSEPTSPDHFAYQVRSAAGHTDCQVAFDEARAAYQERLEAFQNAVLGLEPL